MIGEELNQSKIVIFVLPQSINKSQFIVEKKSFGTIYKEKPLAVIIEERKASGSDCLDDGLKFLVPAQDFKIRRDSFEILERPSDRPLRLRSQVSLSFDQPDIGSVFCPELNEKHFLRARSWTLSKLRSMQKEEEDEDQEEESSESGSEFSLNLSGGALSTEEPVSGHRVSETIPPEDTHVPRQRSRAVDKSIFKDVSPRNSGSDFEENVSYSMPSAHFLLRKQTIDFTTRKLSDDSPASARPFERAYSEFPQELRKFAGKIPPSVNLLTHTPISPKVSEIPSQKS